MIEDGTKPTVSITYFEPDERKAGGKYMTITEKIKKIDPVARKVILMKTVGSAGMNATFDIAWITEIHGDLVDYMDDGIHSPENTLSCPYLSTIFVYSGFLS